MTPSNSSASGINKDYEKILSSVNGYNLLIDSLSVGVYFISPDFRVIKFNDKVEEWFPKVERGKYCYDALKNRNNGKLCENCPAKRSLKTRKKESEILKIQINGKEKYFSIISSPIFYQENKLLGIINIIDDISDKKYLDKSISNYVKKLESKFKSQSKNLKDSKRKYKKLFEAFLPTIIVNESFELVDFNSGFANFTKEFFKKDIEKKKTLSIRDFLSVSESKIIFRYFKKAIIKNIAQKCENFRGQDNSQFNLNFIPFKTDGETHVMVVVENITDRKIIEQENTAFLNNLKEQIRISTNILFKSDTKKIIEEIVNSISEFTDFQSVLFSLFKKEFPYRDIFVSKNIPKEDVEKIAQIPEKAENYYQEITKGVKIEVADVGVAYYFPPTHYKYLNHDKVIYSDIEYNNGSSWHKTDELFIPIFDSKNNLLGALSLDDPQSGKAPTKESLIPIILFARQLSYILEKRKLVEELQASEARYRKLIQASPDIIYSLNTDGCFTFINNEVKRILGYEPEEMIGEHFTKFVHPDDKNIINFRFNERRTGTRATRGLEIRLLTKDQQVKDFDINYAVVEVSATGIYDKDVRTKGKKYLGTQGIARDITEKKILHQQVVQSEKLASLGEVIAEIIHELNNPLSVIMGYSQILSMYDDMPKKAKDNIEKILSEAKRSKKIVRNLLDFVRKKELKISSLNINHVLEKTIALREYDFKVSNIDIIRNFEKGIPLIKGDEDQLQQVFLNIINNAYDAMYEFKRRGVLKINTYCRKRKIFIEFIDNGPGVKKEIQDRLFEPFITTKKTGKGTGLGISLSFKIIKEHKGQIYLDKSYTSGAKFVIRLPDKKTFDEMKKKHPEEDKTVNIFMFCNDTSCLDEYQETIIKNRYKIEFETDFNTVKEMISEFDFDVILTTIKGFDEDKTCIDLFDFIKKEKPSLKKKVIFIFGENIEEEILDYIKKSGNAVLRIPFTSEEFETTINRVFKN